MERHGHTKLYIRASKEKSFDGIGIFIFEKGEGKVYQGKITFEEVDNKVERIEETLFASEYDLCQSNNMPQVLMDDLWECGIRPSEGQGSAGQLRAVENHLSDMRKITFKKLEINEQK